VFSNQTFQAFQEHQKFQVFQEKQQHVLRVFQEMSRGGKSFKSVKNMFQKPFAPETNSIFVLARVRTVTFWRFANQTKHQFEFQEHH